jgi:hypothetical protein
MRKFEKIKKDQEDRLQTIKDQIATIHIHAELLESNVEEVNGIINVI